MPSLKEFRESHALTATTVFFNSSRCFLQQVRQKRLRELRSEVFYLEVILLMSPLFSSIFVWVHCLGFGWVWTGYNPFFVPHSVKKGKEQIVVNVKVHLTSFDGWV